MLDAMRTNYAEGAYSPAAATLDDLSEAVTTLEETAPIARRVLGGAHPLTSWIEGSLSRASRAPRPRNAAPKRRQPRPSNLITTS